MEMLALTDENVAARLRAYKQGLGAKIEKANRDLAEILTSSLFCAIIWRKMKINELRRING